MAQDYLFCESSVLESLINWIIYGTVLSLKPLWDKQWVDTIYFLVLNRNISIIIGDRILLVFIPTVFPLLSFSFLQFSHKMGLTSNLAKFISRISSISYTSPNNCCPAILFRYVKFLLLIVEKKLKDMSRTHIHSHSADLKNSGPIIIIL